MSTRTWTSKHLEGIVTFIVIGIALAVPVNSMSATEPRQKEWGVRYDSGTKPMRSGAKMKLTLEENRAVLRFQHEMFLSIPLSEVMELSLDSRTRYPLADAQGRYTEAVYDAASDDIEGIVNAHLDPAIEALGVASVAAGIVVAAVPAAVMTVPIHSKQHVVTIY